jgi:hypothetical protein
LVTSSIIDSVIARGENIDHSAAGIDLGPFKDGWKIE